MASVDYIINARHYSTRHGGDGTARGFILRWREKLHKERGVSVQINGLESPQGAAVDAYIHQGQWIAECDECGGAEFIDPADPVFFCFGCGNRNNNGYARPVNVPADFEQIESEVLRRPVNDTRGLDELERAGMARATVVVEVDGEALPLVRSWKPDETLDDLKAQNAVLDGLKVGRDVVVIKIQKPAPEPVVEVVLPDQGADNGI